MARHKNVNWNLPEGNPSHSWDSIKTSLLMDIRDELRELNRTLGCYRVQQMCDDVRRIDKRLAKSMLINKRKAA